MRTRESINAHRKRRYENDLEYHARIREYNREYARKRRLNPDYREQEREYKRNRVRKANTDMIGD